MSSSRPFEDLTLKDLQATTLKYLAALVDRVPDPDDRTEATAPTTELLTLLCSLQEERILRLEAESRRGFRVSLN